MVERSAEITDVILAMLAGAIYMFLRRRPAEKSAG
jgi:hypothetical protein